MSKCHVVTFIIPAAFMLAGCPESQSPVAGPTVALEGSEHQVLRVKADLERGRRWELGWGTAYVYDVASEKLIRRVPLPGATFSGARETCLPDMMLNRSGALIVSSNAEPVLWRINPEHFEVERIDIALDSDKDHDFGFSGLAWGGDGKTVYAVSAVTGTSWRIDLDAASASKITSSSGKPGPARCGEASRGADDLRPRTRPEIGASSRHGGPFEFS